MAENKFEGKLSRKREERKKEEVESAIAFNNIPEENERLYLADLCRLQYFLIMLGSQVMLDEGCERQYL